MNRKYLAFLAVVPIFAVLTVFLSDSVETSEISTNEFIGTGAGHFTVTVHDSMGNLISQRQTDNIIVNAGENCIAKMIFGDSVDAGTGVCTGTTDEGWDFFCLDEDPAINFDESDMRNPADEAGLAACRQAAQTWNQNSTGQIDSLSKVTLRLSSTFTNTGASETIQAVGVFNSSTVATNSMLSKANFTSTAVPNGGTLTVNYDFEVGGGTVP